MFWNFFKKIRERLLDTFKGGFSSSSSSSSSTTTTTSDDDDLKSSRQ